MAPVQHFRSALNGFNREDVVRYIEYLNNFFNSQIQQLNTQLQNAMAKPVAEEDSDLRAQLDAALAKCAELEEQLAARSATETARGAVAASCTEEELEAYRRAEKAERMARERAQQIYAQANAVLAEAALKAEEAATQINAAADQATAQLQACQESVLGTKDTFQEAVAALYAIRPEEV